MIRSMQADIFTLRVEAIVNPVNCVGVMGKGLALQFKEHYPLNFEHYKAACQQNRVRIGHLFVHDTRGSTPRYVVNFPTKLHWRDPSHPLFIQQGLMALHDWLLSYGVKSIAIPKLGCGLGQLSWPEVRAQIEMALQDLECEIFLLE